MYTCERLLCCTISATGVEATEQPHPSSPRIGGLGEERASKNRLSEVALSHCVGGEWLA